MDNVVSLRAVRTQKECERLFEGYKKRLSVFSKDEMSTEVARFQSEMKNYPNHLLTLVKGKILLHELLRRGSTNASIPGLLQTIEQRFAERLKVSV